MGILSPHASSCKQILHHQGNKLRKPCRGTGRCPYASCQFWKNRNWHTPYSILFFNLQNKQVVLLLLRLGVCKPCCHLSWQSSSRARATAPAFLSCYAPERVFLFQKMFGRCLFPYSQHICSTLTQMDCLITVCISRGLNAYVVKSRMFS